jgi:FKBP-type peptidyl-prolyl cis-trans isomerase FkpA
MKKSIVFLVCSLLFFAIGCEDDSLSQEEQLAKDIKKIEKYLEENNLTAQKTSSGLHYIIDEQGTGSNPNAYSDVEVKYVGKFTNDEVFDQGTATFNLSGVIEGWTEGIPYFKEGGKGKLLIPSYLGYGKDGFSYLIPANSVLVFDIDLIDIKD